MLCRANACSREPGCSCRSPVLWTQCVLAHSVRSSGPTTSSSARYTQRLPPFYLPDLVLLRRRMSASQQAQPASLIRMHSADRRRQQLGQGPLHRGCRVDRLGLGCRAEGGGELRLPPRYAHSTAFERTLTQPRCSEWLSLATTINRQSLTGTPKHCSNAPLQSCSLIMEAAKRIRVSRSSLLLSQACTKPPSWACRLPGGTLPGRWHRLWHGYPAHQQD